MPALETRCTRHDNDACTFVLYTYHCAHHVRPDLRHSRYAPQSQDPVLTVKGFLYAAVVLSGGAMGFIKKGSVASLAAGGISGVLLGYGAWVSFDEDGCARDGQTR